jgi:hypothetical protein
MRIDMRWLDTLRRWGQKAGPYFVLEMLLPGGTLLALLLFAFERRRPGTATDMRRAILAGRRWLASGFQQALLAPAAMKNYQPIVEIESRQTTIGERWP